MELNSDQLNIDTPELVTIEFPLAGIGSRFIALLVDYLIWGAAFLVLSLLAALILPDIKAFSNISEQWAVAIFTIIFFLFNWGYFTLFEAFWNGCTPGKRVAHIRVIQRSGRAIGLFESMARNFVRYIDQLPFCYVVGVISMFVTRQHQRLGDLAAGTLVVRDRRQEEPLTGRHMDLAASVQKVLVEIVLRITRSLAAETGIPNLCLAGGVALNCVANGHILRDGAFRNLWIQPAAGDAGGALGAALSAYHAFAAQPRVVSGSADSMQGAYLGPDFPQTEIETRLQAAGARFHVLDDESLLSTCAEELISGAALGWFQGRMEFGPRALGARSILADARSTKTQSLLNLKVKFRESFRPFAPSVLRERVADWFELDGDSPYMLLVANVREDHRIPMTPAQEALFGIDKLNVPRSDIPAVTHVDYSARIQTVHRATNPRYYALLQQFYERTGCPVIVNTSFNVRGEPIVCTPEDAFHCFMGTNMEALAAGNCFLRKSEQDSSLAQQYQSKFDLD